jgi:hypothetical protein
VARLLVRSVSKLRSIEDIVRLESETLGPDLRMVILTDFIRRTDFPKDKADVKPIKRLGVVPIFEQIRRSGGVSETVREKPVPCGMGFQSLLHRQDADATKPLGRDARATSQTPSHSLSKLGILTGTLTVIPCESCDALRAIAPKLGIEPAELVYTRTPEGRRFLLKARTHSMSRRFQGRSERLKSWQ